MLRVWVAGTVCRIANTLRAMQTWDNHLPIYRQLADHLAGSLLDGTPPEGETMPSVRALAGQFLLNPLTVHRALQILGDEGLVETRRGLSIYVKPGARARLVAAQRNHFISEEWPRLRRRLQQLGIGAQQLQWEEQR